MTAPDRMTEMLFAWRATGAGSANNVDWDDSMVEATLHSVADFARDILSPANEPGDREGSRLENGKVLLPKSFESAYADYIAQGLNLLGLPAEHGGMHAPTAVRAMTSEILAAANHSFQMLVGLVPGAAEILSTHGTPEQANRLIAPFVTGEALATMCLTESDAGSDLSAIRTTAEQTADGDWRITGTKIFASGGSQSMSQTILHMVLARTGTSEDGRPLLSLFAVPDGPEVEVRRIEEKLGLHASPTCTLEFSSAPGELIGEMGKGLSHMFTLMNDARMDVAMQAVGHAAATLELASEYAETRRQGRGPDGKPVAIAEHGDVRRMLDEIEADVTGLRAMGLMALSKQNAGLVDFLTPVIKAYCTDYGFWATDTAMQVLGGYGYLPEYGIEQHWRDARITRIYEGTNGIMAMTLVTRLMELQDGALANAFAARVETMADAAPERAKQAIKTLWNQWQNTQELVCAERDRGAVASAFLTLTGHLWQAAGWGVLLAQAKEHTDPARLKRLGRFALNRIVSDARKQSGLIEAELSSNGADH